MMEAIAERQKIFVQNFIVNSTRLMEFGFAYLFAHPEWVPLMDCEMEKIRSLEKIQSRSPVDQCQYQLYMRKAFIDYIMKISMLGFKYVKAHPETFKEISDLKKIFVEYEKLRSDLEIARILNRKRENIKFKGKKADAQAAPMEEFKKLREILGNIQDQLKGIYRSPRDGRLSENTSSLKNHIRLLNQQQEAQYAEPVQQKKNIPKQSPKEILVIDSDRESSEYLIRHEQFSKPLNEKPRGPIERYFTIPIHTDKPTKIVPRILFQKSPIDGSMQLDLNLNFEHGVRYKNKLVNGICIKSAFPVPNCRSNVKD